MPAAPAAAIVVLWGHAVQIMLFVCTLSCTLPSSCVLTQRCHFAYKQENELTTLIARDPGHHSEFKDAAWISVPKAGGGVKFYNYVLKKFREMHNEKLSRDVHYKPEARLRVAEDAMIALVRPAPALSHNRVLRFFIRAHLHCIGFWLWRLLICLGNL